MDRSEKAEGRRHTSIHAAQNRIRASVTLEHVPVDDFWVAVLDNFVLEEGKVIVVESLFTKMIEEDSRIT